jgi:hypothetical protein
MKKVLTVVFLIIITNSCALFESESFEGNWNLNLTGDYSGELNFVVDKDGKLSGASLVEVQGYKYDVYYTGTVTPEGDLTAKIEASGREVGELIGKVNFEKGNGTWSASGLKGSWSAIKQVD